MFEKIVFYLYFICKFLLAIPGLKITKEYLNLATCMAQGKELALAPFVLGAFYKGMFTFVNKGITNACGGPLWIFQAWLYAYFPRIKPKFGMPLREEVDEGQCGSYAEFLLSYTLETEDISFERYFKTFDDPLTIPTFMPFAELKYSSTQLKPFFDESEVITPEKERF